MATNRELADAIPSGALDKPDPDYKYIRLQPSGVIVDSIFGDLKDEPGEQQLLGQWECKSVELSTNAGDETFRINDPAAKWFLGITDDRRLLLSVGRGATPIGDLVDKRNRTVLVFTWPFDQIMEIHVGRVKRLMKWWNEELILTANDGVGRLRIGFASPYVGASAKALVKSLASATDGVPVKLVDTLGNSVARSRTGSAASWSKSRDSRDEETWVLRFDD